LKLNNLNPKQKDNNSQKNIPKDLKKRKDFYRSMSKKPFMEVPTDHQENMMLSFKIIMKTLSTNTMYLHLNVQN